MAAIDKAFLKLVNLVGVKATPLSRRVPLAAKSVGTRFPETASSSILDGLNVTSVSVDQQPATADNMIGEIVSAAGGHMSDASDQKKIDAVVFDARGIKTLENLGLLHVKLNPLIPKLAKNGRIVTITDDSTSTPVASSIAGAVGGFTKALGKEVALKGVTANMIRLCSESNSTLSVGLPGTLQFLLSKRSAFITAQFFKMQHAVSPALTNAVGSKPDPASLFSVVGKKVLVTGAARGIGEYMARLVKS